MNDLHLVAPLEIAALSFCLMVIDNVQTTIVCFLNPRGIPLITPPPPPPPGGGGGGRFVWRDNARPASAWLWAARLAGLTDSRRACQLPRWHN